MKRPIPCWQVCYIDRHNTKRSVVVEARTEMEAEDKARLTLHPNDEIRLTLPASGSEPTMSESGSLRRRLQIENDDMQERIGRLKAALAPFVKFITIYEGSDARNGAMLHRDLPDDFAIYVHTSRAGEAVITLGDLRGAKKALEAL